MFSCGRVNYPWLQECNPCIPVSYPGKWRAGGKSIRKLSIFPVKRTFNFREAVFQHRDTGKLFLLLTV